MNQKINTVRIGDDFEERSLQIINKILLSGQLAIIKEYVRVYSKKKYYSNEREKEIIFDIVIEVWPPNAERYSLIYFIECKSYKTRVPVNKVEDFISKIRQVSGVHAKGIFITNSPLQEAAKNIAKNVGLMVIEAEANDNYKIIYYNGSNRMEYSAIPTLVNNYNSESLNNIKNIESEIDSQIKSAFEEITSSSWVSYRIDKLSKKDIELITNEELNSFNSKILTEGYIYELKDLVPYLKNKYGLDVEYSNSKDLLGSCDIRNNRIILNNSIRGTKRELFVFAHELGHYFLHQKLSIGQTLYDNFNDSKYNFSTNRYELKNPRHWIEWQANYFACSFILPEFPFRARVAYCQIALELPRGHIYLDDQKDNIRNFLVLIDRLSYLFDVSKTTIIYRLKEFEMLTNKSRLKSIGEHISELFIDLK